MQTDDSPSPLHQAKPATSSTATSGKKNSITSRTRHDMPLEFALQGLLQLCSIPHASPPRGEGGKSLAAAASSKTSALPFAPAASPTSVSEAFPFAIPDIEVDKTIKASSITAMPEQQVPATAAAAAARVQQEESRERDRPISGLSLERMDEAIPKQSEGGADATKAPAAALLSAKNDDTIMVAGQGQKKNIQQPVPFHRKGPGSDGKAAAASTLPAIGIKSSKSHRVGLSSSPRTMMSAAPAAPPPLQSDAEKGLRPTVLPPPTTTTINTMQGSRPSFVTTMSASSSSASLAAIAANGGGLLPPRMSPDYRPAMGQAQGGRGSSSSHPCPCPECLGIKFTASTPTANTRGLPIPGPSMNGGRGGGALGGPQMTRLLSPPPPFTWAIPPSPQGGGSAPASASVGGVQPTTRILSNSPSGHTATIPTMVMMMAANSPRGGTLRSTSAPSLTRGPTTAGFSMQPTSFMSNGQSHLLPSSPTSSSYMHHPQQQQQQPRPTFPPYAANTIAPSTMPSPSTRPASSDRNNINKGPMNGGNFFPPRGGIMRMPTGSCGAEGCGASPRNGISMMVRGSPPPPRGFIVTSSPFPAQFQPASSPPQASSPPSSSLALQPPLQQQQQQQQQPQQQQQLLSFPQARMSADPTFSSILSSSHPGPFNKDTTTPTTSLSSMSLQMVSQPPSVSHSTSVFSISSSAMSMSSMKPSLKRPLGMVESKGGEASSVIGDEGSVTAMSESDAGSSLGDEEVGGEGGTNAAQAASDGVTVQKISIALPTDTLDPAAVIASDPAKAQQIVEHVVNTASVSTAQQALEDEPNSVITQEITMVPSTIASPVVLSQNQETRVKNLEKIPPEVLMCLERKLGMIPAWDVRITREKLEILGGKIMNDSSPVLMEGERSEHVTNYAPKNFHLQCEHCLKSFTGKNALRNFELHAIFWELYRAHPAIVRAAATDPTAIAAAEATAAAAAATATATSSASSSSSAAVEAAESAIPVLRAVKALAEVEAGHHRVVYPCNSVSRDVVVFMEAKKPILCNNQKKVWKLQGNLHHDTSLFQGRAWLQVPAKKSWESCKLADPNSLQEVLWCRAGKTLEQYETLRAHAFTWHDTGCFTHCDHCNRVYQNTRAFLNHGCIKKGFDKEEMMVTDITQYMTSLIDFSPDFAKLFYQLTKLPTERKEEVFERVTKRLRTSNI